MPPEAQGTPAYEVSTDEKVSQQRKSKGRKEARAVQCGRQENRIWRKEPSVACNSPEKSCKMKT